MSIKVAKFGGTSMADKNAILQVKKILESDEERRFVVVSAPGKRFKGDEKVTDLLYSAYDEKKATGSCALYFDKIRERFLAIVQELGLDFDITPYLDEIEQKIGEDDNRDYAASRGEYLSALIASRVFHLEFVDAADIIRFNKKGIYDASYSNDLVAKRLSFLKGAVIPGFYGSLPDGKIKTFTRGGSDFTGAIVARGVQANVYENWTDVDGFMTADPRVVENPVIIDYLSYEEFKYLVPLCTSEETTSLIIDYIRQLRSNVNNIDSIIVDFLLSKDNYRNGISRFSENDFSEDLLLSVGMNRKSAAYDKSYVALYNEMHKVFMENDNTRIYALFESLSGAKFQSSIAIKWKSMFFDTTSSKAIRNNPEEHFLSLPNCITCSEQAFKRFFFKKMHLFKAKATLEDYFDLNRRYLGLTNCFLFSDGQVKLDIVPKQFFNSVIDELYELAYQRSGDLFRNTSLEEICPALSFNEQVIIDGINNDLNTSITTIDEAFNEVDRIRYERFNALINDKFSDESLIQLLSDFENRDDDRINSYITDNADIPTIFEYVLGVIWYKTSNKQGKVLDYMKLSLDANLLPVTHAAGGEADIVYEYRECSAYPAHNVLLEATLADSTNQRRMEMEPVSRHVGNHILNYGNTNSYGIFVTPYLHLNVISDFKSRKHTPYFDSQDEERYIPGMKITPLDTNDLKAIITSKIKYNQLYRKFEDAYQRSDSYPNPKKWYDETIKMHS